MAAEKLAQELQEKLIRTDEQLSLYERFYEESNSERKELSERMQKFSGFIREVSVESNVTKQDFKPIRGKFIPAAQTQRFLESYWRRKQAALEKALLANDATSVTNG